MFGVSFDIGTTTCVVHAVDLRNGAAAAVESTINHQASFGADVIARVGQGDARARGASSSCRRRSLETVNGLLGQRPARRRRRPRGGLRSRRGRQRDDAAPAARRDPESIALVAVRRDVPRGAGPPRRPTSGFAIHPLGWVALFPSIGAYVGADIVADIVATGLVRDPETRLLVDVGTNGEIACGNAERVGRHGGAGGPGVRGRRDPVRDARHRGRDRGRRPRRDGEVRRCR